MRNMSSQDECIIPIIESGKIPDGTVSISKEEMMYRSVVNLLIPIEYSEYKGTLTSERYILLKIILVYISTFTKK